ncbi:MAG: ATP-binding protein [Bacteroidales bacterium]|nr:ATP-binding protein [Bacteroidales bacterium]
MKKKNTDSENLQGLFQPTFGNRPEQYIGRDGVIEQFMEGLREPVGSRNRCTLFLGQRGMGKTALLLELSDRATKTGYVVARVTAHEGMPKAIIEQFQLNGSQYFNDEKRKMTGVTAGVLGFTLGLTFSEAAERQYGFRSKMSLLCDKLAEKGKGALILIDEVRTSTAMREVAAAYQELVGDKKNVAIAMAGLPHAVSSVLNDQVLTFLNRATKVELGLISTNLIRAYYERAFKTVGVKISDTLLDRAALATRGFPYLMQLIGYYLIQYTEEGGTVNRKIMDKVEKAAMSDMEDNVFKPILSPLSDNDLLFLKAMARQGDVVTTAKLQSALGKKGPAIQPYRKRLLDAGVIESPRRGELVFAVPYLAEYLLQDRN